MMRLGKLHLDLISAVALKAMAGECQVEIPAPTWKAAREIFKAVTPYMEQRGARAAERGYKWFFSNGSEVALNVAA